jgi:hypothetical protein
MSLRTCVSPEGRFILGLHRPAFTAANLREDDYPAPLGAGPARTPIMNLGNFPAGDVAAPDSAWIYEIPNPFPFRGVTFIKKDWADSRAANPAAIALPAQPAVSLASSLALIWPESDASEIDRVFGALPSPLLLALATTSTDPADLVRLARLACTFVEGGDPDHPAGLSYESDHRGGWRAAIRHHDLFEAVANNPHLPDPYKVIMVLRPGAQGGSEIVGEVRREGTHVFEYLRANSYIAWGHYAANLADDAIRYSLADLTPADMSGLRHLYYQRTYHRLAEDLGVKPLPRRRALAPEELETLRLEICRRLGTGQRSRWTATLWGWNYGFDFAPTSYRLHASHQQIHQQYALLPGEISAAGGQTLPGYGCGDPVTAFCADYRRETGRDFFAALLCAIATNTRTDGQGHGPSSLVLFEDEQVLLFVPKAQTSQWELQLMAKEPVGNIIEADRRMRRALDHGLFLAMRTLHTLGAKMVTVIEFSKRFDNPDRDQRLFYSLLPRLPESPGAFSEAQLRWINGHYPEDFAAACRLILTGGEGDNNRSSLDNR